LLFPMFGLVKRAEGDTLALCGDAPPSCCGCFASGEVTPSCCGEAIPNCCGEVTPSGESIVGEVIPAVGLVVHSGSGCARIVFSSSPEPGMSKTELSVG
jgi:hypothetical protein